MATESPTAAEQEPRIPKDERIHAFRELGFIMLGVVERNAVEGQLFTSPRELRKQTLAEAIRQGLPEADASLADLAFWRGLNDGCLELADNMRGVSITEVGKRWLNERQPVQLELS